MPGRITIFVDEAGNVDFSHGASKTFVIGYVYVQAPSRISCDIKKLRGRLCKTYGLDIPEFKFHKDKKAVKNKFLKLISKMPLSCGYVAVNKDAVNNYLKDNPDKLYNYLAVHYPIKRIIHEFKPDEIEYVLDKQSWSRERRASFDSYILNKASWVATVECNSNCPEIRPSHENSRLNPCLQVADYISGSVYRAAESGDATYYSVIKDKFKKGWMEKWGSVRI